MQTGFRLKTSQRQKAIYRLTAITAGIALMAGIGFFVTANFGTSADSLASGNLLRSGNSAALSSTQLQGSAISSMEVIPNENNVHIRWTSTNEENVKLFTVERSNGTAPFSTLAVLNPEANAGEEKTYTLTDDRPVNGTLHYRLNILKKDGTSQQFPDVTIEWRGKATSLQIKSVSPNPFKNDFIVNVRSEKEQSMSLYLYNVQGQKVAEHTTEKYSGNRLINLNPGDDLPAGIYVLTVIGEDNIPGTVRLQKI